MIPMIFLTAHSGCDTENILGKGRGWRKEVSSGAGEVVRVRDDWHLRLGGGWVDGIPPRADGSW